MATAHPPLKQLGAARGLEAYPLSHMQSGMLFHSISAPGSDVYVEQLACSLEGRLDLSAFQFAWRQILEHHAVLRTAFAWRRLPEPLQVVGSRVDLPLEKFDWSGESPSSQAVRLRDLRDAERAAGFDLSRAPLMRLRLAHLSETSHQLIWTWHHIILDAWSVAIILEEFFALYDARRNEREIHLDPACPFKNFIAWQRSAELFPAEKFWRELLDGFAEPTPLGSDGEQDDKDSAGYGLEFLPLALSEIFALRGAARQSRVTINTLAQAAWALLLNRYSGREDVLFGIAVSGRSPELPGVEKMVGLLINTIPVRGCASPQKKLGEWLAEFQSMHVRMLPFQHAPLLEVQNWSHVPRGTQLFESLFVFENFPVNVCRLCGGGLALADFDFVERANFPLTVMMAIREGARLGAGYHRSRFEPAAIVRMLSHFRALLVAVAGDAGQVLSHLDCLPPEEQHQILRQWSYSPQRPNSIPFRLPIHRLLEAVVERTPGAPAATFASLEDETTLTYCLLNAKANALALRLREMGIALEDRVAICMEPSLPRLVSLLAVIKAGAAYVPLDPASPKALLLDLISDCTPRLILADPDLVIGFSGIKDTRVVPIAGNDIEGQAENLTEGPSAENLAYIIYTSGSTGRPKGVAITHAALLHLVHSQIAAFQIDSHSRVLQFASLSFDASVSEIFTALLAGSRLYMAPRRLLVPSREFVAWMDRCRITTATFPPSVMVSLPLSHLPSLTTLVSAGEACSAELVQRWAPNRRFLNAYGPTECAVCASISELTDYARKPSIGRPMGEARIYILDSILRPVPLGVAGDLFVSGPGVARGYWNHPGMTAAVFIPDPFSAEPGSRMYRTGDRARFLANGEIAFLGREDDQIKLRGFRIELGEIEAALRDDSSVSNAAVVVEQRNSTGDKSLVACVVPKDSGATSRAQWWPSIAEYLVYDELAYHAMTSDERRNISYRAAIAEKVQDRVVVEVGTGPEALLARFCVEAGARKVYAIELLADTYARACARVQELGLEERIVVIHGDAATVNLPQPAEVCVSEIVGSIGGCEGAAAIMLSVQRLLAPRAEMIPARSTTLYAPVQLPDDLIQGMGFGPLPARYTGKIFAEIGHPFDLRLCVKGLNRSHLLAQPGIFENLDFRSLVALPSRHESDFQIQRDGRLDGFLAWLTLDTGAGEQIDILEHEHCWLPVFFPVFDSGMLVSTGDRIETISGAVLCEDGVHPDYFIEGFVHRGVTTMPFRHYSPHHGGQFRSTGFYRRFFQNGNIPRLKEDAAPAPGSKLSAIRERLHNRLPEHMVPSDFVEFERFPLLPSGKIDRHSLLKAVSRRVRGAKQELTPVSSEVEQVIARIWREILCLDEVGRQTNFFDHGGHSLLLLKVQDHIKEKLGLDVLITDLFKYPTVETLGERLSLQSGSGGSGEQDSSRLRASARQEAMAERSQLKAKAKAMGKQWKETMKAALKDEMKAALKDGNPSIES